MWNPGELEKEIESGRWNIVKVPPTDVLSQNVRDGLWAKARNRLRLQQVNDPEAEN